MKINLTDSEWISLLDGEIEGSQLPRCCANISALRDVFMSIVRDGRNDDIQDWQIQDLRQKLKWVADGHDIENFPVLMKVVECVGGLPEEHEAGYTE